MLIMLIIDYADYLIIVAVTMSVRLDTIVPAPLC